MKMLPDRLMVRNGAFYFRLWIPKDIVPVYGRQLVVTSLRTKDLKRHAWPGRLWKLKSSSRNFA